MRDGAPTTPRARRRAHWTSPRAAAQRRQRGSPSGDRRCLVLAFAREPGDERAAAPARRRGLRVARGRARRRRALAERPRPRSRDARGRRQRSSAPIARARHARRRRPACSCPLAVGGARARRARGRRRRRRSHAAARDAVELAAGVVAVRLDHAARSRRGRGAARAARRASIATADEKSDEVLKLSEALFAQDIELLRNNEKLGKIEKLKNDFIEKMSRELRTPLNSIIEAIIAVLAGENDALSETAPRRACAARSTTAPRSCARSRTSSTCGASSRASCPSRSRT